jgi:hypothetical protein
MLPRQLFAPVVAPLVTLAALEHLSAADFALLGAHDGNATLADYGSTSYFKFSPAQLAILIARIPKPTAAPTATMDLSILSPRMAAVLTSSTGSSLCSHSYCGSLGFLDSQKSFDTIFPHPASLLLSLSHSGTLTVNTHTISITASYQFH